MDLGAVGLLWRRLLLCGSRAEPEVVEGNDLGIGNGDGAVLPAVDVGECYQHLLLLVGECVDGEGLGLCIGSVGHLGGDILGHLVSGLCLANESLNVRDLVIGEHLHDLDALTDTLVVGDLGEEAIEYFFLAKGDRLARVAILETGIGCELGELPTGESLDTGADELDLAMMGVHGIAEITEARESDIGVESLGTIEEDGILENVTANAQKVLEFLVDAKAQTSVAGE
jgi:hypothetical protein